MTERLRKWESAGWRYCNGYKTSSWEYQGRFVKRLTGRFAAHRMNAGFSGNRRQSLAEQKTQRSFPPQNALQR